MKQQEWIAFLEHLDRTLAADVTRIHIVCDNARPHTGKKVRTWLTQHPRFVSHFTPAHCSWMNQVEQWFGLLQRKGWRIADFASLDGRRTKLYAFIKEWNQSAHPFQWTSKSVAQVMAYVEAHEVAA